MSTLWRPPRSRTRLPSRARTPAPGAGPWGPGRPASGRHVARRQWPRVPPATGALSQPRSSEWWLSWSEALGLRAGLKASPEGPGWGRGRGWFGPFFKFLQWQSNLGGGKMYERRLPLIPCPTSASSLCAFY